MIQPLGQRMGLALLTLTAATPCVAQTTAPAQQQAAPASRMARDDVMALAKLSLSAAQVRDSIQKELAEPRNKTPQAQQQLLLLAVGRLSPS
ncbi:MAG: hypothetical protein ABI877_15540 [Gemmatimonadaceae bacterium]